MTAGHPARALEHKSSRTDKVRRCRRSDLFEGTTCIRKANFLASYTRDNHCQTRGRRSSKALLIFPKLIRGPLLGGGSYPICNCVIREILFPHQVAPSLKVFLPAVGSRMRACSEISHLFACQGPMACLLGAASPLPSVRGKRV